MITLTPLGLVFLSASTPCTQLDHPPFDLRQREFEVSQQQFPPSELPNRS